VRKSCLEGALVGLVCYVEREHRRLQALPLEFLRSNRPPFKLRRNSRSLSHALAAFAWESYAGGKEAGRCFLVRAQQK
jgi:hypothetical protein